MLTFLSGDIFLCCPAIPATSVEECSSRRLQEHIGVLRQLDGQMCVVSMKTEKHKTVWMMWQKKLEW